MEIVEAALTDRVDAMYDENGSVVNIRGFNVSVYQQTDSFVRIGQIDYPDPPLCDAGFLHVTLLPASFRMNSFDYSHSTIPTSFYTEVSADSVTMSLTGDLTVDRQVLNNGAKVLLLDKLHRLKAMRRLHAKAGVDWIHQNILALLII